jgi:hypothetical protein
MVTVFNYEHCTLSMLTVFCAINTPPSPVCICRCEVRDLNRGVNFSITTSEQVKSEKIKQQLARNKEVELQTNC